MFSLFKLFFTICACLFFAAAGAQVHADFAATVPADCAPVAVRFSDSTKGNATKWVWDFGNGDTSHQQNPSATYLAAGTYAVKLIASNNNSVDSVIKIITIIGSVKAGFTYGYDNVCAAPSSFTFNAVNKADSILYAWNFGNGSTANTSSASTVYNANGSFTVRLITATPQGCKDTSSKVFNIGSATASFSSYSVVCINAPALFTNTSSPIPLSINWYVNGANAGTGNTLTHTFTSSGSYDVKMVAGFGTCTQTADKTITVKDKPVAGFSESGSLQSCTLPATINFTNTSTNANAYQWIFGDGNTSAQTNSTYTYNSSGTFSPSLVAFNGDGCSDTLTKANLVRLGPPVITGFTALPKSGCIPENITSGANINSPDPVATYDWNTGDNNQHVSGSQFNHIYTNEGYYNVALNVTTKNGCTGSFSLHQAVAAGRIPTPDFTVDDSSVCASTPVKFIDETTPHATSWNWNFGDGQSTSGQSPSHTFTKVGSNDVTLYVSNFGCSAPGFTKQKVVTILPPIAKFGVNYNCANPLLVSFTDSSVQPQSWNWNFGDAQTSSSPSPQHTYETSGNYSAILTTTNGSCTSSDTALVTVTNQKPTVQVSPQKSFICRNDSLIFTAKNNAGFVANYSWNVSDGSPVINDSSVSHIYTSSGTYQPFVAVQYINKCRDTVYTNQPVNVYGPKANFALTQQGNCLPLAVVFTNNSTTDNSHAIVATTWNYGDGQTGGAKNNQYTHTYLTGGSFIPKLMVTDAVGCTDSFVSKKPIVAKGAAAGFRDTITSSCDSAEVIFSDTSKAYNDVITSYSWNFGDGNNATSSLQNPTHTYYSSGNYTVTQTVTTGSGCTVISTQKITISIAAKPVINISGPIESCVATSVLLSAHVSGNAPVVQWNWNLGNGTDQTGQTVNTIYNQSGTYNIVVVVSLGGCADTSYQKIIINDAPKTNAGIDSFVCAGSSVSLQASGAETYTWQNPNNNLSCTNCASPVATPTSPTYYIVTGESAAGCSSLDSVFIDIQQKETVSVATDNVSACAGKTVQLSASGTDYFLWQPAAGLSDASLSNPVASPSVTTVYTVTGSDKKHCFTDTKQITLTIIPLPSFNILDSVITVSRGAKQILQTSGSPDIVRWMWQPATGLSCSDCAQPTLTATINGIYTATAYTADGCSNSDSIKIILLCDQNGIFIPTAFTPNGDGKNDFFYPVSFADTKVVSFTIFSRSGEVIFHRQNTSTNANKDGWNGTYKSMPMPSDTYVYNIEIQCEKEVISFTGTVVLIR